MKQYEAEQKAKELWGDYGFAYRTNTNDYVVGEIISGIFRQSYGVGSSWESAFKSAKLNIN